MNGPGPGGAVDAVQPIVGLFLNLGANLAADEDGVFAFTQKQAQLAMCCGYQELWVTEHHFIPFGINPSALTTSAYLLGEFPAMRVGTAVTLAPVVHPVDLAERAALLDQLSGGRFELGLGRGGDRRDYEVLGIDMSRWDSEPEATARLLLEAWQAESFDAHHPVCEVRDICIRPRPSTRGGPPLLLATASGGGVRFAAERGLPLQHYFATPAEQRARVEDAYLAHRPEGPLKPHLHAVLVVIADDEQVARQKLTDALTRSFEDGDHPAVPQAPQRHTDASGSPVARNQLAKSAAQGALVGPPERVAHQLQGFMGRTGARRICCYMEAIADPVLALESIERFMLEVVPRVELAATGR